MKPKLILKLIEAHYQKDEKQFLEYANRIVQCFHGKAKPFVAEMVDAEIKRGLVFVGNNQEPPKLRSRSILRTCRHYFLPWLQAMDIEKMTCNFIENVIQ